MSPSSGNTDVLFMILDVISECLFRAHRVLSPGRDKVTRERVRRMIVAAVKRSVGNRRSASDYALTRGMERCWVGFERRCKRRYKKTGRT